jgi:hypothetical protein
MKIGEREFYAVMKAVSAPLVLMANVRNVASLTMAL